MDVNIQFEKEILTDNINGSNSCIIMKTVDTPDKIEQFMKDEDVDTPDNIRRKLTVEKNDFKFSKFVCDDELKKETDILYIANGLRMHVKMRTSILRYL